MSLGVGWRWFAWLSAIITGLNFAAIFFVVPESRFTRIPVEATNSDPIEVFVDGDKGVATAMMEQLPTDQLQARTSGEKKTFLQNLSLWSGTTKESYFSHFLRPFLLVLYPAVAWATLACKQYYDFVNHQVHSLTLQQIHYI